MHSRKQTVSLTEIQDNILKSLLDKLIRFKHKCSDKGETKLFSQTEMQDHKRSLDCPSKVYKCFCQGHDDTKRFSYQEIFKHLREECEEVVMHCQFCHTSCTHDTGDKMAFTLRKHDDHLKAFNHHQKKTNPAIPHMSTYITRKQMKHHKCFVTTRELDINFQNQEWRIRKIASMYEKTNMSCESCKAPASNDCQCAACKAAAHKKAVSSLTATACGCNSCGTGCDKCSSGNCAECYCCPLAQNKSATFVSSCECTSCPTGCDKCANGNCGECECCPTGCKKCATGACNECACCSKGCVKCANGTCANCDCYP